MNVIPYTFDPDRIAQFVGLLGGLYPRNRYVSAYQQSAAVLLDGENPYFQQAAVQNFLALDGGRPIGHVTATVDARQPTIGNVGFFEAARSDVAAALLEQTTEWFARRRVSRLRGPINLTIWHQYRFMRPVSLQHQFYFEPFNHAAYPDYFQQRGFFVAERYLSGLRHDLNPIIVHTLPHYRSSLAAGYVIRPIRLDDFENELKILHRLSLDTFRNSWSFVELSFAEFLFLYQGVRSHVNPRYCQFICHRRRPVGFCFSLPDPWAPHPTLIMKTIGIVPEHQRHSLGSALIYQQHCQAREDGYRTVIYALMRQGNVAAQINPYDATEFRRYEAYESPSLRPAQKRV